MFEDSVQSYKSRGVESRALAAFNELFMTFFEILALSFKDTSEVSQGTLMADMESLERCAKILVPGFDGEVAIGWHERVKERILELANKFKFNFKNNTEVAPSVKRPPLSVVRLKTRDFRRNPLLTFINRSGLVQSRALAHGRDVRRVRPCPHGRCGVRRLDGRDLHQPQQEVVQDVGGRHPVV